MKKTRRLFGLFVLFLLVLLLPMQASTAQDNYENVSAREICEETWAIVEERARQERDRRVAEFENLERFYVIGERMYLDEDASSRCLHTWVLVSETPLTPTTRPDFCGTVFRTEVIDRCIHCYFQSSFIIYTGFAHMWSTYLAPPCTEHCLFCLRTRALPCTQWSPTQSINGICQQRCNSCSRTRTVPCARWGPTHAFNGTCQQSCTTCSRRRSVSCTFVPVGGHLRCSICGFILW